MIDNLKKSFNKADLKMESLVKIFKPKVIKRYDPSVITRVCNMMLKALPKYSNISSATSTPINCKNNERIGSVQNSSLKKRDFNEYEA